MSELAYTLLSDGSSDRMLMPAIDWLLGVHAARLFYGQWADLRRLPRPPKLLGGRIQTALELYPCDLLFVHRDAENASRQTRVTEIDEALAHSVNTTRVPVIPVRMQEAWFLFDEAAIREAAGNPYGSKDLSLPPLKNVEQIPDPKAVLDWTLSTASDLHGRRLAKMKLGQAKHCLSTLITDFAPLREVPAFAALEKELASVLVLNGWIRPP